MFLYYELYYAVVNYNQIRSVFSTTGAGLMERLFRGPGVRYHEGSSAILITPPSRAGMMMGDSR